VRALLLVAVALSVAPGCRGRDAPKGRPGAHRDKEARPVPVRVRPVRRGTLARTRTFVGELVAPEAVEIAARVAGRLARVPLKLGRSVRRGELLAAVDVRTTAAQLAEAQAALAVARAAAARSQVELAHAERDLQRRQPLLAEGVVSQQELDSLQARRDTSRAARDVASAQVRQAEARIATLRSQVAEAQVYAPFTGRVEARLLDPGAVVQPGTPIGRLVRTDPVVAAFRVPERQVGQLSARVAAGEARVVLEVPALPGERFQATVSGISPTLERASRSARVEAEVDNPEARLMPGMFCRVEVDLGAAADALLLPLVAVVEAGAGPGGAAAPAPRRVDVYVVEGGRARRVTVSLGAETDGLGEVLGGLAEGARVVVEGHGRLPGPGGPVEVVEAPATSPDGGAAP